MRYFFDTEFIEDGKTIDLISIGMVADDGREFYAESSECDLERAGPWVKENVLPHLLGKGALMTRAQIARHIVDFIGERNSVIQPQFWADYGAYDWVALCQLFGTMMDLPKGWPMFVLDIQQYRAQLGNPRLPAQDGMRTAPSMTRDIVGGLGNSCMTERRGLAAMSMWTPHER